MLITEKQLNLRIRKMNGIISTDDIIPAKYKHQFTDPKDLAPHVFENKLPGFSATLRNGDAIISNSTFGIGSSREQAVSALLAAGVTAIIAPAFGRIFFRNAWNLGLIALLADMDQSIELNQITLRLNKGEILMDNKIYRFNSIPVEMLKVLECGGLLSYVKRGM